MALTVNADELVPRVTYYDRTVTATIVVAYLAIGTALIVQPERFGNTPSYGLLLDVLPQWAWGICYLVVAVGMALAMYPSSYRRPFAVVGHTAGVALTAGWFFAFMVRYVTDDSTTIVNVVSWAVFLSLIIRSAIALNDRPLT